MKEVFEKIKERLKEKSFMVATSKSFWSSPQNGAYVENVVTFQNAIEIVNQVAEECNDGWIPCSERLPQNSDIHEVTAQFVNGKCYTEFAYYDLIREEWWKHDDDGLVNVIAWKKPSAPYKQKGEK